jgi:hypothetical protein
MAVVYEGLYNRYLAIPCPVLLGLLSVFINLELSDRLE